MPQTISFGGAETILAKALAAAITANGGTFTDAQLVSLLSTMFQTALSA